MTLFHHVLKKSRLLHFFVSTFIECLFPLLSNAHHDVDPHSLNNLGYSVKYFSSAPSGLKKPKDPIPEDSDLHRQLTEANKQRMKEIEDNSTGRTVWLFADATQKDNKCGGAWAFFDNPDAKGTPIAEGIIGAGDRACVYTGEVRTLLHALSELQKDSFLRKHPQLQQMQTLNIITDSLSTLISTEKTPIRKMNYHEQLICQIVHELARSRSLNINLGFVFSHFGVQGNEYVDKKAKTNINNFSNWDASVSYPFYDTWRYTKKTYVTPQHRETMLNYNNKKHMPFRLRQLTKIFPDDYTSKNAEQPLRFPDVIVLPKTLRTVGTARHEEIRLNYATLGMIPEIGGRIHNNKRLPKASRDDKCPFCEKRRLGRNGKTMKHIARKCKNRELKELLKDESGNKINLIKCLWTKPRQAMDTLLKVVSTAADKLKNKNEQQKFTLFNYIPFCNFSFKNRNNDNNKNIKKSSLYSSFNKNNKNENTSSLSSNSNQQTQNSIIISDKNKTSFSSHNTTNIFSKHWHEESIQSNGPLLSIETDCSSDSEPEVGSHLPTKELRKCASSY